ncbi:hypothetical protein Ancab_005168 [Ancistrocladus abbreviatus]
MLAMGKLVQHKHSAQRESGVAGPCDQAPYGLVKGVTHLVVKCDSECVVMMVKGHRSVRVAFLRLLNEIGSVV